MKLNYSVGVVILTFIISSMSAMAAEGQSNSKLSPIDSLRCERFATDNVAELKMKLIENCDLNKPYSFTSAGNALNQAITYCCQKKQ